MRSADWRISWQCCSHDQQFSALPTDQAGLDDSHLWISVQGVCPCEGPGHPSQVGGPYISSCWTAEWTSCTFDHDRWRMTSVPKIWRLKQKHQEAKVWVMLRKYSNIDEKQWCISHTATATWWWNKPLRSSLLTSWPAGNRKRRTTFRSDNAAEWRLCSISLVRAPSQSTGLLWQRCSTRPNLVFSSFEIPRCSWTQHTDSSAAPPNRSWFRPNWV